MDFWDFFFWFLFAWVAVASIWVFVAVVFDLFRDHDLSGVAKAVWLIFLVLLPLLGVLFYLITRGDAMAARNAQVMPDPARASSTGDASASKAEEIERAQSLLSSGAITRDEFDALKASALT